MSFLYISRIANTNPHINPTKVPRFHHTVSGLIGNGFIFVKFTSSFAETGIIVNLCGMPLI